MDAKLDLQYHQLNRSHWNQPTGLQYIQSLCVRTRTDIALGLLAIFPIEAKIDLRKLILFWPAMQIKFQLLG